ncbi:MAG TPA: winged helix-turn-helix transcriptional regulator [Methanocella sp.]|nr:winged helix-turn-helix transcriptional regulator [Methanocella sp.]
MVYDIHGAQRKMRHIIIVFLVLVVIISGSAEVQDSLQPNTSRISTLTPGGQPSNSYQPGTMGGKTDLYVPSMDPVIGPSCANTAGASIKTPPISRARSLVHLNRNRNLIMRFVTDNPGSRLHDIISSLGMNRGTARYHLMILGLNHRLVEYQDGARQVRYFTNTGIYSEEHMSIISLIRREPTGELLSALTGRAGMTSAEIATVTGRPYSDVNRYLKELISKGVVIKEPLVRNKYQYRIAPGLEALVVKNVGLQK